MPTTFTVTEQHLTLLRNANVGWNHCEFGAPEIDPKRPYGNSSVLFDIATLLHPEFAQMRTGAQEDWLEDNADRLRQIHQETQTVLLIALSTGEFRAGAYVRGDGYDASWVRRDSLTDSAVRSSTEPGA